MLSGEPERREKNAAKTWRKRKKEEGKGCAGFVSKMSGLGRAAKIVRRLLSRFVIRGLL